MFYFFVDCSKVSYHIASILLFQQNAANWSNDFSAHFGFTLVIVFIWCSSDHAFISLLSISLVLPALALSLITGLSSTSTQWRYIHCVVQHCDAVFYIVDHSPFQVNSPFSGVQRDMTCVEYICYHSHQQIYSTNRRNCNRFLYVYLIFSIPSIHNGLKSNILSASKIFAKQVSCKSTVNCTLTV